jgi:DHA2 family multidrug resistance protein
MKLLAGIVQREALVLTFNDVILMMGALFALGLFVMPLVRRRNSLMG